MPEDELEEELRPGLCAELGGEFGQGPVARLAKKRVPPEGQVDEHGRARVARRRQQGLLRLTGAERVVHLEEIGLLACQHFADRVVGAYLASRDADVAANALLLPLPQQ